MAMLDNDYPGRTPRRYVMTYRIEDANRKIMIDPSAFWIGNLRLMTRAKKKEAAQIWQAWQADPESVKKLPFQDRLFYVPFEQRTYTRRRSTRGYEKETLNLVEQPMTALEWIIQHELHRKQSGRKFKSAHPWNRDAAGILYLNHPTFSPYAGTSNTVAHVRADSSARNPGVPSYRIVAITDLFGKEGHYITDASSRAEGFAWEAAKEGRTDIVVIDKHIAAVMEFAKYYPEKFREYQTKYGSAWLPIDMKASFKHEGVSFREPEHFPGIAPDRRVLIMDILMYYLFESKNGGTLFDISKKMMQMHFLMDPSVIEGIREGRMHFEVLTQAHAIPDISDEKVRMLRQMYTAIHRQLTAKGYVLDSHTLEFGNTDYETVAFNYVRYEGTSARVLFHPTYAVPPLIMYKKERPGNRNEATLHKTSPISLLAKMPHISVDDWTRQTADTWVEVPNVFITDEIKEDYKARIAEEYEGGIQQFRNNVIARYGYRSQDRLDSLARKEMQRKLLWLIK